MHYGLELGPRV